MNARRLAKLAQRAVRARLTALIAAMLATAAISAAAESGPELAGQMLTSLSATLGTPYPGSPGRPSFGAEQYSNLRLEAPLGERGTAFAALNLVAAAGDALPASVAAAAALGAETGAFVVGRGYAAALELERLYYRIEGERLGLEAGLLRLAFGFGQAWSPSDFLAERNPLFPDARPRGSLAAAAFAYPGGDWKLRAFAAAGKEALESGVEGAVAGASAELHGKGGSVQALYAIEADASGARYATHRIGLSAKVEAGAGIVLDALYTLDRDLVDSDYFGLGWSALRGLEASVGADYSLSGGDLYLLAQYLYRGGSALDPGEGLEDLYGGDEGWSGQAPSARALDPALAPIFGELNRRDYLYASLTWRIGDYDSATLSCVACLDDGSFVPSLSYEREPFQGLIVGLDCRLPLDARTFSASGGYGELGSAHSGSRAMLRARARLRF